MLVLQQILRDHEGMAMQMVDIEVLIQELGIRRITKRA
ncbi:hypothetical protein VCHC33A2_0274 [Vibrio cholerae HC-33A2]|nr:hypothetical protein VCHC33A2_0274 [Vibrio cholerae HC-33A2]EMP99060.1 hypothetical protein VCAG7404_000257 [Vibrio cholerae O1 str. AG-7404]EMQ43162.1 hypothetical protein VCEM1626_000274 [Vibrio cholerae O1 str. EM-1626]